MKFKKKLYDILVAKQPSIRHKYTSYKKQGKAPLKKAVYLFRLNFSYHILRDKKLSRFGESKSKPYCKGAESGLSLRKSPEAFAEELSEFDAVSFDIFDTLILRPFAEPADLFHIVGAETELLNFAETRVNCEREAREKHFKASGSYEIDIDDIYEYMTEYAGSDYAGARETELETEMNLCYANPYMKRVWNLLQEKNVKIFVISDMYLKSKFLETLLIKSGFEGFEKLFVSNEYGCSKNDGKLYEIAKLQMPKGKLAHVGDNAHSDVKNSSEHGFVSFACNNVNACGSSYRPDEMSRIVGSAYKGIVNAKFHNGLEEYPPLYEYGYAYSGLFVLGFCGYIHKIRQKTQADKVLFLARDGDLLKKIYNKLYPKDSTEYFLWSRLAAVKLCFSENISDFNRRFVYHKCNGKYTAKELLQQAELEELSEICPLKNTIITEKNYRELGQFIVDNKEAVSEIYAPQGEGARKYFEKKIGGSKKALAVDVGWAGSGGADIGALCKKWGIDTEIIGVIAGTNDIYSEQPDASEALLQSGRLYSYCFSQSHNRSIYTTHDSSQGHNAFFEMLLGSETPSLKGFTAEGEPIFAENESGNEESVRLIHKGAVDFCEDYLKRFADYPYMQNIGGSDAYAPFLAAVRDGNEYFKFVLGGCRFDFDIGVKGEKLKERI